ncbi:hypothetical protein [Mucilaginibacter sp. 3215]|uniref:hypothetical protein n=1 Tax=Mucilaginibacter sp. 3215 TaxID=3373912 RepID=UPI003D1F29F6
MTNNNIKDALKPLEYKMKQYIKTNTVMLTSAEITLMKEVYPHYNKLAGGQLPTVFNTGCSSCVKQVFSYYISFYFRK